jgi:hypothetical protein
MPGFLTSWIKPDTPYVPLMASLVPASKVVARITKDLAG